MIYDMYTMYICSTCVLLLGFCRNCWQFITLQMTIKALRFTETRKGKGMGKKCEKWGRKRASYNNAISDSMSQCVRTNTCNSQKADENRIHNNASSSEYYIYIWVFLLICFLFSVVLWCVCSSQCWHFQYFLWMFTSNSSFQWRWTKMKKTTCKWLSDWLFASFSSWKNWNWKDLCMQ